MNLIAVFVRKGQSLLIDRDRFGIVALKGKNRTNRQINFNVCRMKTLRFFEQVECLVVLLQGHDEHCVRILLEFHEVGHATDDAALRGRAEGGLVDWAVGGDEAVIGRVEVPACLVAVPLGPAFVLRLQDAAGAAARPSGLGGAPTSVRGRVYIQ